MCRKCQHLFFSEEADLQYRRDKKVEEEMIKILAGRVRDCLLYNQGQTGGSMTGPNEHDNPCQAMIVRSIIMFSHEIFFSIRNNHLVLIFKMSDKQFLITG